MQRLTATAICKEMGSVWTLPSGVNEATCYPLVEQEQPDSALAPVFTPPSSAPQDKSHILSWPQPFPVLQQTLSSTHPYPAAAEQEMGRGRVLVCMMDVGRCI